MGMETPDAQTALLTRARRRRLAALIEAEMPASPHAPPAHVPPVTRDVVLALMGRREA